MPPGRDRRYGIGHDDDLGGEPVRPGRRHPESARADELLSNQSTFQADGTGSVLDVSALTNVTQQGPWDIDATNGGTLNLSGLTSLTCTNIIAITDTGGSTLNLSGLTSLTSTASFGYGTRIDPTPAAAPCSTATSPALPPTSLPASRSRSTAQTRTSPTPGTASPTAPSTSSAVTYTLPGLTDVDGSSLYVYCRLPGAAGLTSLDANYSTFQSDGAGSVLDVSALSNVTQQGPLWLDATDGGTLNLGGLASLTNTQGIYITDTDSSTLETAS